MCVERIKLLLWDIKYGCREDCQEERGGRDVIGAADEMNRLNQGQLQGQEGVHCCSLSSSKRSLKLHLIIAARRSGVVTRSTPQCIY